MSKYKLYGRTVVFHKSKADQSRGWCHQTWIQVDKIGKKYEVTEYDFIDAKLIGTFPTEQEAIKFAEKA